MIVPMQKLSLLVFHRDYADFLEQLRERGVVHVHEDRKRSANDEELKQKLAVIKRVTTLAKALARRAASATPDAGFASAWAAAGDLPGRLACCQRYFRLTADALPPVDNPLGVLECLEHVLARQQQIEQQIAALQKDAALYAPWGPLPTDRLEALRQAGWETRFYTVAEKKYRPEWEEGYQAFPIHAGRGILYFVAFQPTGAEAIAGADPFHFPAASLPDIENDTRDLRHEQERLSACLDGAASTMVDYLSTLKAAVLEETDLLKVRDAATPILSDRVIALEGWIPVSLVPEMEAWLSARDAVYEFADPGPGDKPPVQLRNNRFARLFEFIGELYSLPTYREIDLTPFFAPFFVLFFGLCLGDAGYGLLFLLAFTLVKCKASPAFRPICSLGQWLGIGTLLMGFVSGTFFGIGLLDVQLPWLQRFKAVMLDSSQLFNLSLIIGVVQILFGMCIKVVNLWRQTGPASTLSTIGWLIAILGGGLCYLLSSRGVDTRLLTYVVLGAAAVMVFLLNNPRRNPLVNIGAGLWDSYNMITGLLGDVLSYIRLFALGISGSVLGLVFNNLAVNMSGDVPVLKQVIMLVILLFGHGVNIFMSGLGAFVHPMRLTFVEFYKNAGFEGGGQKYNPLRKRIMSTKS